MFSLSVTANFAPEGQTEICEKRRHESLVFITYAQKPPLHVNIYTDVSNITRYLSVALTCIPCVCEKQRHESLVLVFITYAQNSPLHVNAVHPDVSNKTRITFNLIPLAYLAYMRSKYSGKPVHFAQACLSFRCTSM